MINSRSTAGRTFSLLFSRAQEKSVLLIDAKSGEPDAVPVLVDVGAGAVNCPFEISPGKSPGKITSPLETTVARSMTFSSSRTFPGQVNSCNSLRVFSEIAFGLPFCSEANFFKK